MKFVNENVNGAGYREKNMQQFSKNANFWRTKIIREKC